MRKTAVLLEAFIGLDPESPKTWSGSVPFLLDAMRSAGRFDCTYPLALSPLRRALLLAKNYSRDRAIWRRHYYLDPSYSKAVTSLAAKTGYSGNFTLQFGALFSAPDAFPTKKCLSMHDGNLAERVNSDFGLKGVSSKRIEEALRFEEHAAQGMTAICTLSEYLRQSFIRNYRVHPDKVFNIGGGINLRDVPSLADKKNYSDQRILFIGSEFVRKGGPQLIEAFRIVRESAPAAELHIVGPTHIPDVPSGVIFHGHLSKTIPEQKATLNQLFRSCSLFVMPSLYEPYGIAPLEAMLYEMPCIVTDDWALGELVTNGFNGALVQKGSVEDLAVKILDLLSDPERLAVMGRNGRNMVLPRYTWPTVVDRLGQVMDNI